MCSAHFPISALFIQDDSDRVKLVRKNERTSFVRNTSNQETILESLITKGDSRMWGGIIDMPAGTDSGDYYYHGGEEFVFVMEGSITFYLEQVGSYVLEVGDTLYYPNEIGHRWENHTKEPAKFLIVSTSEFGAEKSANSQTKHLTRPDADNNFHVGHIEKIPRTSVTAYIKQPG